MFIFRKLRSWFTRPRPVPPFVWEIEVDGMRQRFEAPTAKGIIELILLKNAAADDVVNEDKRPKAHVETIFDELLK